MVKKICLMMAEITSVAVDAMINPAHASLKPGSGLCGVMHKKGGVQMTDACAVIYKEKGIFTEGSATTTEAGKLPAHHVIHAITPIWFDGEKNEDEKLYQTYVAIFQQAEKFNASVISIPALATGIHRFPKERAARIAIQAMLDCLPNQRLPHTVLLINMDKESSHAYAKAFTEQHKKAESFDVELVNFLPMLSNCS